MKDKIVIALANSKIKRKLKESQFESQIYCLKIFVIALANSNRPEVIKIDIY